MITQPLIKSLLSPLLRDSLGIDPLLFMPLNNSLNLVYGVGSATFTRSSNGTFLDVATGFIQTASSNVPRFEAQGLLIEGASTNPMLRSEEFDNAAWEKTASSITANNAVAPDGNTTMDLIVPNTSNTGHWVLQNTSITSGLDYTQTVYVKAGGYNFFQIASSTGFVSEFINIDLTDGSIGNKSTGITAIVTDMGNGVFRMEVTLTAIGTVSGKLIFVPLPSDIDSRLPSYIGDGVSGVNLWGAQIEQSEFASSYIKTTTIAVTRSADDLSIDSDNIPAIADDYTITTDFDILKVTTGGFARLYEVAGEAQRRALINADDLIAKHGASTSSTGVNVVTGNQQQFAFVVDSTNQTLFVDKIQVDQDTKGTPTGTKTSINIGRESSNQLNGHLKNFRIYNVALTSQQVKAL